LTGALLRGQDADGQPFQFTLSPAPGTGSGSPLDGQVTVLAGR